MEKPAATTGGERERADAAAAATLAANVEVESSRAAGTAVRETNM
jgi:hypothetical protein